MRFFVLGTNRNFVPLNREVHACTNVGLCSIICVNRLKRIYLGLANLLPRYGKSYCLSIKLQRASRFPSQHRQSQTLSKHWLCLSSTLKLCTYQMTQANLGSGEIHYHGYTCNKFIPDSASQRHNQNINIPLYTL